MRQATRTRLVLSGTWVHQNLTTEQTFIEIQPAQWGGGVAYIRAVIDCDAFTKNTTFRARMQLDGVNFHALRSPHTLAAADELDQYEEIAVADVPIRYTLQSASSEGATRNIPYKIIIET